MADNDNAQTVASMTLSDCPTGFVFNRADPDTQLEETVFKDWIEPCRQPVAESASYRAWVVTDDRTGTLRPPPATPTRVLQHEDKRDSALFTGEDTWGDYTIETVVRQLIATSSPDMDDEYRTDARTGLVFRVRSVRRFYHFGTEGNGDFVLHRRCDEEWIELGRAGTSVDRPRYHTLRVEINGASIRCYLDDQLAIEVEDDTYTAGKTGIRTNTVARFTGVRVSMTADQQADNAEAAGRKEAERQRRSRDVSQPVLWRELDIGNALPVGFGRHAECDSPVAYLLAVENASDSGSTQSTLTAMDMQGHTIWRRAHDGLFIQGTTPRYIDFTGDGCTDILCILNEKLTIIDGASGDVRIAQEPPEACRLMGFRNTPALPGLRRPGVKLNTICVEPGNVPSHIIMSDDSAAGGNGIWAYDQALAPLWSTEVSLPRFGHSTFAADFDGDGRDEILAGSYLFDADGNRVWELENHEYWDRFRGAKHVDMSYLVDLGEHPGAGPTVILAGGAEGLFFADPATGAIRKRHMIGHVQHAVSGNFRPDLPGLETWALTRHGNYGIAALFDCRGDERFYFQPHYERVPGPRVNWRGDGSHLLLLNGTELQGLFDGEGFKVAEYPWQSCALQGAFVLDVCGDERDELLFAGNGTLRIFTQA